MQIVEAVLELPIGQVLVQLDRVERVHTDTAFTLGAIRGLILALALGLAGWPIAAFYGDPKLQFLLPLLGVAPAMRGLASPRMALFARGLDFRRDFLTDISGKLAALLLSTVAALALRDYRALVVGTVAAPMVATLASYVVAPYRPRLSLAAWPAFRRFVGWSTASQLLAATIWQCDRLALARFVTPARVGEFSLANDLAYVPEQALIKPIVRPLMSAFAAVRDDPDRLRSGFDKAATAILMVGLPMMIGLSVLAEPTVRLMLGGKWLRAIPILQWLPLTLIPPLATAAMPALAMSLGQPDVMWRQLRFEAIRIPLTVLGAWGYGVPGVLGARGLGAILAAGASFHFTRRLIGMSIGRQVARLSRVLLAGGVLAAVLVPLSGLLSGLEGFALLLGLAGVTVLGAAAYGGALLLLWLFAGKPRGLESVAVEQFHVVWRRNGRTGSARR